MDTLIGDFIFKMGLPIPVAILVGVSAGKLLPTLTALTFEGEITKCAVAVLKDQIVEKLTNVYTVYRDTSPTGGGHFPAEVNLREVAERVLFSVDDVHWLNHLYIDLSDLGTQSESFGQVIQFLGG